MGNWGFKNGFRYIKKRTNDFIAFMQWKLLAFLYSLFIEAEFLFRVSFCSETQCSQWMEKNQSIKNKRHFCFIFTSQLDWSIMHMWFIGQFNFSIITLKSWRQQTLLFQAFCWAIKMEIGKPFIIVIIKGNVFSIKATFCCIRIQITWMHLLFSHQQKKQSFHYFFLLKDKYMLCIHLFIQKR